MAGCVERAARAGHGADGHGEGRRDLARAGHRDCAHSVRSTPQLSSCTRLMPWGTDAEPSSRWPFAWKQAQRATRHGNATILPTQH